LYLQNISSITWISNPSTLSVSGEGYSRNASDYPFGIYKLLFYYRQLWIRHLRNLYTFPKTSKSIKTKLECYLSLRQNLQLVTNLDVFVHVIAKTCKNLS
jgi:hypothetical protein